MRKWMPLVTVCLGTFMLLIDVTIVNVALPNMVGDLGASPRRAPGPAGCRTRRPWMSVSCDP
jgi:MFS family permease